LLRDEVAATSQSMRRTTPHAILEMRRMIAKWAIIQLGISKDVQPKRLTISAQCD